MNIKHFILGLSLGTIILGGCNDDLNYVGPSIQPDKDKLQVFTDTFNIEASTILMGPIYARTDSGLLGQIYDPLYGNLKSDYICQLYCPANFKFQYEPINGKIDSVHFMVLYNSWVGDPLAPMQLQLYKVTEPLDRYFYTDVNPADYCDMQTILGKQAFTAVDLSVSDSLRNLDDYVSNIILKLDTEIGQNFYNETLNNPSTFASQESFNNYFPGFYVTTTFGSGSILNVSNSYFRIYYDYIIEGSQGQDSTVVGFETFNVTREVIQMNNFHNTDLASLTVPNDEFTYLKTPAGVCTKITIPSSQLAPMLEGRTLNNFQFSLDAMPQENWEYAFTPSSRLLLIQEDSLKTFFEEGKIQDNVTSFLSTTYSSSSPTYNFNNICAMLQNQFEKDPDSDLNLLVIPVNVTTETDSYYYVEYTTSITHQFTPSGVKLRKDPDKTQFVVVSSKYN